MRIITHGNKPLPFRFFCSECGCVFEVDKRECNRVVYSGIFDAVATNCPECGEVTFQNKEDKEFYVKLRGGAI